MEQRNKSCKREIRYHGGPLFSCSPQGYLRIQKRTKHIFTSLLMNTPPPCLLGRLIWINWMNSLKHTSWSLSDVATDYILMGQYLICMWPFVITKLVSIFIFLLIQFEGGILIFTRLRVPGKPLTTPRCIISINRSTTLVLIINHNMKSFNFQI